MRLYYLNKTPDWLRILLTFTKWPVPGRCVVCWLLQPPGIPGSPVSWMSKTQGHGPRRALGVVLGFAFLVLAAFSPLLHSSRPRRSDCGIEASRGKMAPECGLGTTMVCQFLPVQRWPVFYPSACYCIFRVPGVRMPRSRVMLFSECHFQERSMHSVLAS